MCQDWTTPNLVQSEFSVVNNRNPHRPAYINHKINVNRPGVELRNFPIVQIPVATATASEQYKSFLNQSERNKHNRD